MVNITYNEVLHDVFIIVKLAVHAVYSTIELLIKNFILPASLTTKSIDNKIILVTGAGMYAFK